MLPMVLGVSTSSETTSIAWEFTPVIEKIFGAKNCQMMIFQLRTWDRYIKEASERICTCLKKDFCTFVKRLFAALRFETF